MAESPFSTRAHQILETAVRVATGNPDARPRPGQMMLLDDMVAAADPLGGHMAGIAKTGVGKSLTGLSLAAAGVVDYEQRWLLSTESIGLQAQYVDKDGPVIAKAAKEATGKDVKVAVLKGWSNYVCAMKARDAARQMGHPASSGESQIVQHAARVSRANLPEEVTIDGVPMKSSVVQPLVAWALRQHADENLPADKGHYSGATTDVEWRAVSIAPQECQGENECPLASICKPLMARQKAADADIVITNHSMLAVQAATGTPVVIGNSKLGRFDGIIVDEAHTLPGVVRNQGQSFISGRRIMQLRAKVTSVGDDRDPNLTKWRGDGSTLADYVDGELRQRVHGAGDNLRMAEGQDPLADTGDLIEQWIKAGLRLAATASKVKGDLSAMIQAKRVITELEQAGHDLDSVREHRVGTARWLEKPTAGINGGREWAAAQAAPVQVGGMMNRNLWNETMKSESDEDEDVQRPLTVCMISATLPEGFARDAGIRAIPRAYPTPFDEAFSRSCLFVPRAVDAADVEALGRYNDWSKKWKFDTGAHQAWAQQHIIDLVDANGGSALILTAKADDGKKYAAALRSVARGRWKVYSQWDGENARVITSRWRDDETSVMVGTKSLMTGVDAPGETNTLVIVDRIPRSPSNPVDDARKEALQEVYDEFTAERFVYVADAALLLEQAAGRLIRSMSDYGMVAVLDPRLLKNGPYQYSAPARNTYMKAVEMFPTRFSRSEPALEWLRGHRHRRARG